MLGVGIYAIDLGGIGCSYLIQFVETIADGLNLALDVFLCGKRVSDEMDHVGIIAVPKVATLHRLQRLAGRVAARRGGSSLPCWRGLLAARTGCSLLRERRN